MAESETKRQRYRRLAHATSISGQTVSALRDVLATLQADAISRPQLLAAYHTRFHEVARVERLPCTHGTHFNWQYADPFALHRLILELSPAFPQVFIDARRKYPNSPTHPWHVVAAFDEFTPGNKSKVIRKTVDFVYSFAELGDDALSLTATWILPVCVRSSMLKAVEGQWSRVLAIILRKLFMGPEDLQMCRVVVSLSTSGATSYMKSLWRACIQCAVQFAARPCVRIAGARACCPPPRTHRRARIRHTCVCEENTIRSAISFAAASIGQGMSWLSSRSTTFFYVIVNELTLIEAETPE